MKKGIGCMLLLVIVLFCCKTTSDKREQLAEENREAAFVLPDIPPMYSTPEARREFLLLHYWDHFNFNDTLLINRADITEQAFADFIFLFSGAEPEIVRKGVYKMLEEAAGSDRMYTYFLELSDKYLYDPNSPMKDEEAYLMVLEYFFAHTDADGAETSKLRFRREMLYKNRPGTPAADIEIRLASGTTIRLYQIKSELTVLFFKNPGCQACKDIHHVLVNSLVIKKAEAEGKLKIVAVYPDEDLEEWKRELPAVPDHWINGYDEELIITRDNVYDLKAIPSLYLLDRDKKVILRDVSVEAIVNYIYRY